MNFRCKFRHRRSIRRPRFLIRVQNFGHLATFSVDFCILYAECPPYFYFRFVWPTDLESIPHASTRTLIIPTKFEVVWPSTAELQLFLSADTSRDLVTLTLDLLTVNSCHTWRVTCPTLPPSLKTLRQFIHELRVITVPIDYHRKCVRCHCACAESRDPWVGGQKRLHFWNPRPRFAYSLWLYDFYWATTTIKGRLLSSRPMLKPFSGKKNSVPSKWGPKMAVWRKMGVETLDFGFATPKKHFLARNRVVWRRLFCVKIGSRVSAVAFLKNQKNSRVTLCWRARNHACAEPKPLNRFW